MASLLRPRRYGAAVALGVPLLLVGCPDEPHFDAEGYQLVTQSIVMRDYAGAGGFSQGENWLQPFADYEPQFCSTRTTTVQDGEREVAIDWHGCFVGGTDFVGVFEYVGNGEYEGLIDVTVNLQGGPTTFGVVLRLEPREVE